MGVIRHDDLHLERGGPLDHVVFRESLVVSFRQGSGDLEICNKQRMIPVVFVSWLNAQDSLANVPRCFVAARCCPDVSMEYTRGRFGGHDNDHNHIPAS
jgi:hypothetical protein